MICRGRGIPRQEKGRNHQGRRGRRRLTLAMKSSRGEPKGVFWAGSGTGNGKEGREEEGQIR